MSAGYSTRCKVCNSPHRAEIEKWCKEEGVSTREASRRLAETGERISYEAIRRHMLEHFDVRAEAREQYQKSQAQMEQLAAKVVSEVEMVDRVAKENFELHLATRAWLQRLVEEEKKPPMSLVALHQATAAEVRQQLKQKLELLGEDAVSRTAEALESWLELAMYADKE